MDDLKFTLSRQDAELVGQALDVYGATLLMTPLGLGLDLLVAVRALRERLDQAGLLHQTVSDATDDPDSNIVAFARA